MVYDLLASAAEFRAELQAGDTISDPRSYQKEEFKYLDRWVFNDGETTMSTFSKGSKVCLIVCTSKIIVIENANKVGMEILPR